MRRLVAVESVEDPGVPGLAGTEQEAARAVVNAPVGSELRAGHVSRQIREQKHHHRGDLRSGTVAAQRYPAGDVGDGLVIRLGIAVQPRGGNEAGDHAVHPHAAAPPFGGGGGREGGYGGGGRGGYGGGPREGGEGDGFRQQRPRRDMPPVERGPRQSGTVKFFKNDKGFGFITPDEGDADVFVHISAVERSGFAGLDSGQRVSFETEPDRRGKGPKAVNLQALEEGDAPQEDDGGPAEE